MAALRRDLRITAAIVAIAGLAACGSSGSAGSTRDRALPLRVPDRVTVTTRQVSGLGTILADEQGHALYMFPPDAGGRVTCSGACAGTWPPLVVSSSNRPTAAGSANPEVLSTLPDPNTGDRIVTYSGYPLYRYAGDVRAGTANGQALFLNGGPWYVLNTDGNPVTTDPGNDR